MISCKYCEGTGFLNIDQVPEWIKDDWDSIEEWLVESRLRLDDMSCSCHINSPCPKCEEEHDVEICTCCGDGWGWYGVPGQHYSNDDPQGSEGPYPGGFCLCH